MLRIVSAALTGAAVASLALTNSYGGATAPLQLPLSTGSVAQALYTPAAAAQLLSAPDGRALATIQSEAPLTVLTRERGWVRVRLEGWVREEELVPADTLLRMSPSAADIRADPDGMRGRLVRWNVEFISLQRADPLRRDMTADEWYILARGPAGENAIVYLVVPAALRSQVEALSPLSRISVTARVRVGRSQPVGVPILDLESLSRR